ncbi:MAG TPA: response regulator, partial [Blastocatellia bacterium]|nr:response regulator [Blastocatellia bacterium]
GQGIIPEFLPFVFDRFRQADSTSTRKYGGLGLGLSIVRHLIEMHGGTVRAESNGAGLGATFQVRLPLITAARQTAFSTTGPQPPVEAEGPAAVGEANRWASLRGLRVLVVDDEADARGMLKMMLRQCEADVRVTATAREALEVVTQWRPDVLVSDIGMPDEDGYSLINRVRALKPEEGRDTPAVALTGYAGAGDRTQSLSSGYQIHLSKPVEIGALTSAIADLSKRYAKSFSRQSRERS